MRKQEHNSVEIRGRNQCNLISLVMSKLRTIEKIEKKSPALLEPTPKDTRVQRQT